MRFGTRALTGVVLGFAIGVLSCAAAGGAPGDAATAKQLLALSGVRVGLCIQLGSGRETSDALAAELAAQSDLAVEGLALDDAALARARRAVELKTMSGRVTIGKYAIDPLPYLNDLADLVVVEDPGTLKERGLRVEEIMRVLAPGGMLCVMKDGAWTKAVKPRPAGMDEWTHPNHGPDRNMVSEDKLVGFPMGLRWINGVPTTVSGKSRAYVTAGGRIFILTHNVLENVGDDKRLKPQYLVAYSAWNGLPLWKICCETPNEGGYTFWNNTGALVTDGRRVYTARADGMVGLDAVTGKETISFATEYPVVQLVLLDGVLVTTCWQSRVSSRAPGDYIGGYSTWTARGDVGSVEAYDAARGTLKWKLEHPAQQLIAADGVVYLLAQKGNPPTERSVVALDLATGKERWRVPHARFGGVPDLQLNTAGKGYVVVAKRGDLRGLGAPIKPAGEEPRPHAVYVLSADDGRTLWQVPSLSDSTPGTWTPVVNGELWCDMRKFDPLTGRQTGVIDGGVLDQFCTPRTVVNNMLVNSRGGEFLRMSDGYSPLKEFQYLGARGACIEGMVPANGMFYSAQSNCSCFPGQVPGFLAVGPCGEVPKVEDFERVRPLEKGPAFGAETATDEADDKAWPTYRGDAERRASTKSPLSDTLRELWRVPVARAESGLLADAWRTRLGPSVSAPVSAGGRVFVAVTDAGQIVSLDAFTGKTAWTASLGGRVDTPPTIYRGLCLVGSHDGWVYALRARDGELAWRTRAAPWERRMVAYGQVESVWPTVGSVLVHDGMAFANAGRTSESDGGVGILALNPETGRQLWGACMAPGPQLMNDLLSVRNGKIAWWQARLAPKTGGARGTATPPKGISQTGMLDGAWTEYPSRRSGKGFFAGTTVASLLAWNDEQIFSPVAVVRRGNGETVWEPKFPRTHQVEAMALASNAVVFAGRVKAADGASTGFLTVLSASDGKTLQEMALPALPAFDGLAIACDRLYVSLRDGSLLCLGK